SQEFMGFALDGAKRLSALTDALLDYSRMTPHGDRIEDVDLHLVLERALENLRVMVEESGAVVTSGALPTIRSERVLLVPLFQNLLSNAIKYHKPGVCPRVHITAVLQDGSCLVSV